VVQAEAPETVLGHRGFLETLASKHRETSGPSKIVFVFRQQGPPASRKKLAKVLFYFDPPSDVEFARGGGQAALAIEEAFAKILAGETEGEATSAKRDPLGKVKSVLAATADLRTGAGRLSAQRVAEAFGLSLAELAELVGSKRQTVWKTDDAEALQPALLPFERVARLRAVLQPADFRRWLHMPNDQLAKRSPLEVIRGGDAAAVADLAEDMLTGAPG
jgi:hypothetical protein